MDLKTRRRSATHIDLRRLTNLRERSCSSSFGPAMLALDEER